MAETPVMTTKNTILNRKPEAVTQPSVKDFDLSSLANVGDNPEPELKTVPVVDESQSKPMQPKPMTDGVHSGTVEVQPISPATIDDFMSDSIVARSLRLPNYLDVRCKDPNWIPRWVNFKTQNGSRYYEFKASGFRDAKVEEIVGLSEELQVGSDGKIKNHDVILMIAPKSIVYGAYKQNALSSMRNLGRNALKSAKAESDKVIRQGISAEGFNYGEYGKKLISYIPADNEIGDEGGFRK